MKLFTKRNLYIAVALAVVYVLYTSYDFFTQRPHTSPCPSFCRNAGNMHPACVQGRKEGRPNCGSGGFT